MKIISEAAEEESAPTTTAKIQHELSREVGTCDHFKAEKEASNRLALKMEDELWTLICQDKFPLKRAVRYALAGNFIDLGVFDVIDEKEALNMIETSAEWEIDSPTLNRFENDLRESKRLIYLTDNAGEIVFDKLLIRLLKKEYEHLNIEVIVRGAPILNDATTKDAKDVGMTKVAHVTGNGTNIPGTDLEKISKEAKRLITEADIIISKGMGNFESLYGCDLNIYYAFLCKCEYFSKRFNVGINENIFLHNDDVHRIDSFAERRGDV